MLNWNWGTGLELGIYEAALTHFLGGEETVVRPVAVKRENSIVGQQRMRFAEDGVAFRLTALDRETDAFEEHARRLLKHMELRAIQWVNIGSQRITFTTIE